jgi:OmpA-OmpF porin, OOP family
MANNTHHNDEKNDFNTVSDMPWFRPWLLVAFLAFVIFMLVRGCKDTFKYETLTVSQDPNAAATHGGEGHGAATAHVAETTTETAVGNGSGYEFITYSADTFMVENPETKVVENKFINNSIVHLPNKVNLTTARGGIEEKLAIFLNNPATVVDKTTWFDFDNLKFESGKAKLTTESATQLKHMSELLKAYPTVKLKVGAYTDNTGDSLKNVTLSTQRAQTTVKELVALGIVADRLNAEGYGPQHPIAENTTEEGRAKNRRVSVRVTQK